MGNSMMMMNCSALMCVDLKLKSHLSKCAQDKFKSVRKNCACICLPVIFNGQIVIKYCTTSKIIRESILFSEQRQR